MLKQGLNVNLNINASNNFHMKLLNDKLEEENEHLQKQIDRLEEQLDETEKKLYEVRCESNIMQIEMGKREAEPQIVIGHMQMGDRGKRIEEMEYDQELERKSKMFDSMFVTSGDNLSVRSKNKDKRLQTVLVKDNN